MCVPRILRSELIAAIFNRLQVTFNFQPINPPRVFQQRADARLFAAVLTQSSRFLFWRQRANKSQRRAHSASSRNIADNNRSRKSPPRLLLLRLLLLRRLPLLRLLLRRLLLLARLRNTSGFVVRRFRFRFVGSLSALSDMFVSPGRTLPRGDVPRGYYNFIRSSTLTIVSCSR